ncbi:hypothetical protein CEP54_016325 [Fusarium duplospermum]|uniref:Peptidase A1 domain-containing protein n=1 Tax=Fusarium duplospermum TaxID=1325734 RepID=A0A428NF59_9HYPO|nr:hypothetical protein CEP54_016325 [Fusarium duplospermum]
MTPEQCRSRRGGYLMRNDLPAASSSVRTTLSNLNPGWVNITKSDTGPPFQYAEEMDLKIKDNSITMLQGLITQGQQHTMSHVGLAETSTLLQSLKDEGLIGARSWSLDSGSQSFAAPRNGSLVLGGYDASKLDGGWIAFPIPESNLVRKRPCPLQVSITEMSFTVHVGRDGAKTKTPVKRDNPLVACIEPYDNHFRFPGAYLDEIKELLGNEEYIAAPSEYAGLYSIEPGLVYNASMNRDVSISLTIASGSSELTVEVPSYELGAFVLPERPDSLVLIIILFLSRSTASTRA